MSETMHTPADVRERVRHRIRWIMGDEATADVGVSCGDMTDACVVASDDRERVCPVCGATLRLTWDVRLRESRAACTNGGNDATT